MWILVGNRDINLLFGRIPQYPHQIWNDLLVYSLHISKKSSYTVNIRLHTPQSYLWSLPRASDKQNTAKKGFMLVISPLCIHVTGGNDVCGDYYRPQMSLEWNRSSNYFHVDFRFSRVLSSNICRRNFLTLGNGRTSFLSFRNWLVLLFGKLFVAD